MDYEEFGGLSPERIAREEEARRQYLLNHQGALAQQKSRRGALMELAADPKYQAAEQAMLQQRQMGQLLRTNPKLAVQLMTLQQKQQAASTPKPPAGYRPNATGLEPIPGGPADTKIQGALNQDTSMLQNSQSDLDRLAVEANRLKNHPGLSKTTGLMSVMPLVGGLATVPGTEAADFKAGLNTLKSQTGFTVLQNMRNNSKSGGALGQVSDFENKMLQANLAALDTAQSEGEFKAALDKIIKYTEDAKGRLRGAYNMKHKNASPTSAPAAPSAPRVVDW